MSIEEELHASWGKHAIEDAVDSGELYTREQHELELNRVKEERISDISQIILKMIQTGTPIDVAIDIVPADIRAEVRKRLSDE
jgi:hypothetical protein